MKTIKKIAAIFLTSLLVVCSVPFTASAKVISGVTVTQAGSTFEIFSNGTPITIKAKGSGSCIIVNSTGKEADLSPMPKNADGSYDLSSETCFIYGGSYYEECETSNITVESGNALVIYAGGYRYNVKNANLTVKGGKVFGIVTQVSSSVGDSTINISGNADVDELILGNNIKPTGPSEGICTLNMSGGKVHELSAGCHLSRYNVKFNITGGNFPGCKELLPIMLKDTNNNLQTDDLQPMNSQGKKLVFKQYMFEDANGPLKNKQVSNIVLSDGSSYGSDGVLTDKYGYIYTYVPEGTEVKEAMIDNSYYVLKADGVLTIDMSIRSVSVDKTSPKVGDTITASVSPINATVNYTWSADGVPIEGATEATYTVKPSDEGKKLTVTALATGDYIGTVTADVTVAKKDAPSKTPQKEGNPKTGAVGIGLFAIVSLISATGLKAVSRKKSK